MSLEFRAWCKDPEGDRFYYFTLQEILERRMSYRGNCDEQILRGIKHQWTGLLDKDDNKIYVEDVVTIPSGYGGDNYYPECIAIVKWEAPSFILYNPNDEHGIVGQDVNSNWSDLKVVGNTKQFEEFKKWMT